MAPHPSTLAWKIPWMEEPGGLQSMGFRRVGHNWATSLSLFTFMHWTRKWQPTPVFLPGESQGWGEAGGLPSMGSHRVRDDWSDAAAAEPFADLVITHFCKFKEKGVEILREEGPPGGLGALAVFSRRFGNCCRHGLPPDFTQKVPRLWFSAVVVRAGGEEGRSADLRRTSFSQPMGFPLWPASSSW